MYKGLDYKDTGEENGRTPITNTQRSNERSRSYTATDWIIAGFEFVFRHFDFNSVWPFPFPDNLKENDKEMRAMLKRVWPKLTKKTLDLVVPKPPSRINNGEDCSLVAGAKILVSTKETCVAFFEVRKILSRC